MPENGTKLTNGSGAKAFGGVMAVIAVLGAMVAVMRPMADRLASVEKQLQIHVDKLDHPVAMGKTVEKLSMDFDRHEHAGGHSGLSERVKALESNGVQMRHQTQLIQLLWRRVYEEDLPAVSNGGNH